MKHCEVPSHIRFTERLRGRERIHTNRTLHSDLLADRRWKQQCVEPQTFAPVSKIERSRHRMWIAMCMARDHESVNTILGEVFPHSHGTQYLLYAECRASVPNAEPSRAEPSRISHD